MSDSPYLYAEPRNESIAALISLVEQLSDRVHELSSKLDNDILTRQEERQRVIEEVLHQALPGGDPAQHKRWHESEIAKNEAKAAFWIKMRDELVQKGLIGFAIWAGYWLWTAALHGPGK